MKQYFKDLWDLDHCKKCPNDFSFGRFMVLYIPTFVFVSVIFGLIFALIRPVRCNAEEITYYDWEQVELQSLPEASSSTMNKVYVVEDNYYITNETTTSGGLRNIQLGDFLGNQTLYLSFPSDLGSCIISNYDRFGKELLHFTNSSNTKYRLWVGKSSGYASITFNNDTLFYTSSNINLSEYYLSWDGDVSSSVVTSIFTENDFCNILDYIKLETSSSTSYSWEEVSKDLVIPVIQNKTYVPSESLKCYTFIDRYTLRGYFNKPELNESVKYYDFYLDRHYDSIEGTETIISEVSCLDNITSNYLYRYDIVHVLLFFLMVSIFVIYIPIKILFRLFRRFN